ncbi:MAG TPA: HAD-IA family hydrolase [Phycisphaerae bacterium]|nr:HAD-IA family hydrolase [Phycisphaerae bacterium]HRY68711.1 HAD-IA family hydrolase [Phycisphaerae bacterium]HSA25537.1 HAD-IA family hydrolase [Phycisphaerae bacterium]
MGIQGAIFDLDGTLANTLPDLTEAMNHALGTLGRSPCSQEEVRRWVGEGLPTLCRRALSRSSPGGFDVPDDAMAIRMAQVFTAYYSDHRLGKTRPYEGIPELLDELARRGIPMAVLSNKPHEHTRPMVEALFSRWLWVAVEGYRAEEYRKPDPRTALEIIARMGGQASRIMLVGDSATDIQTGRNAGVVTVGAAWGFRDRPELVDAGADLVIDHPLDLVRYL